MKAFFLRGRCKRTHSIKRTHSNSRSHSSTRVHPSKKAHSGMSLQRFFFCLFLVDKFLLALTIATVAHKGPERVHMPHVQFTRRTSHLTQFSLV
jgi:hypothetical protein